MAVSSLCNLYPVSCVFYHIMGWLARLVPAAQTDQYLLDSIYCDMQYASIYRVSQKNVVSWKNSHNYLQTHPKCKCWGCIGKFRIFATRWALRFSILKKKWLRKWSIKLPTPPKKIVRIHCSHYTLLWWSSAFSWFAMKAKLVPHLGRRVK